MQGLKTFFRYLQSAQKLNPVLLLRYILPTMFDRRTRHSHEVYQQLRRYFARQICDPIYHNVRLSEAPACGKTIFEYAGSARGARDYRKLIERIIDNDDQQKKDP